MHADTNRNKPWRWPILGVLAVMLILAMLRLGIWQLNRADQKQSILDQRIELARQPAVELSELGPDNAQRFQNVMASGRFLAEHTVLADRQVLRGQVGYLVYTPMQIDQTDFHILVARGWVPAGVSRADIPDFPTPRDTVNVSGRLNVAPAKPPLWNDEYPVADGQVWQFLPIDQVAAQMQLNLWPLVLELAPETGPPIGLEIEWQAIDDHWVAKHRGYAFQWFAMALAFLIACLAVLMNVSAKQ